MKELINTKGLVLQCNEIGVIEKIIRDDFNLCAENCAGKTFASLFREGMVAHALDFIMQIKKDSFAFDYWLAITHEKNNTSLYFSGFYLEQKVWVIGAGNSSAMLKFINQLHQINNEQANHIRSLVKKNFNTEQNVSKASEQLNELSRLNNELVNLQREMAKKNAELQRLNELKNQFLGMAAHDLRTPLGNIMSFAEFLEEETEGQLNDDHRKFLKLISTSAEFLLKMIEDLLDISKIESGKLVLNPEPTDLVELAEQNILFNNALASKKNISISLSYSHKPVPVNIDKQKMDQVFSNLLSNAVKFSHPGNPVWVNISRLENKVRVEVTDQGIGLPAKFMEIIFQPFNKVSASGTAGEKSTGLGLSIVKKIIDGHNGKIEVESEEGKGSRFYFDLPLTT